MTSDLQDIPAEIGPRRFPIQTGLSVSWAAAERAYATYAAMFGRQQTLERLAERGGFGLREYCWLYLGKADGGSLSEDAMVRALRAGDVRAGGAS